MTYDCQSDADKPVTDLIKAAMQVANRPTSSSDHAALRTSVMRYLAVFPNPFYDEDDKPPPVRPNHISRGKLDDARKAVLALEIAERGVATLDNDGAAVLEISTHAGVTAVHLPVEHGLGRDIAETIRRERAIALANLGVKPYDEA